jgi:hypothetical protein
MVLMVNQHQPTNQESQHRWFPVQIIGTVPPMRMWFGIIPDSKTWRAGWSSSDTKQFWQYRVPCVWDLPYLPPNTCWMRNDTIPWWPQPCTGPPWWTQPTSMITMIKVLLVCLEKFGMRNNNYIRKSLTITPAILLNNQKTCSLISYSFGTRTAQNSLFGMYTFHGILARVCGTSRRLLVWWRNHIILLRISSSSWRISCHFYWFNLVPPKHKCTYSRNGIPAPMQGLANEIWQDILLLVTPANHHSR